MNCIAAHEKPKIPAAPAASAMLPCSNSTISLGNTGIITPSASMSRATVMKMNTNAAAACGRCGGGPDDESRRAGAIAGVTVAGGAGGELIARHATLERPCILVLGL